MDYIYLIFIIATLLITGGAQAYISLNYKKYKQISVQSGKSGFDVAREILDRNGLFNVMILETSGELSDHYDPQKKCVKLSHDIYHGQTIAAASVASHECGHAIQDKNGYTFLRFRNSIVPLVNIASKLGYIVLLIGAFSTLTGLIWVGIGMEGAILLFQLVTLPVEFNASSRALKLIREYGIVNESEHSGAKKMLTSAALTYVAGVLAAVMDILRLILMYAGRRR